MEEHNCCKCTCCGHIHTYGPLKRIREYLGTDQGSYNRLYLVVTQQVCSECADTKILDSKEVWVRI